MATKGSDLLSRYEEYKKKKNSAQNTEESESKEGSSLLSRYEEYKSGKKTDSTEQSYFDLIEENKRKDEERKALLAYDKEAGLAAINDLESRYNEAKRINDAINERLRIVSYGQRRGGFGQVNEHQIRATDPVIVQLQKEIEAYGDADSLWAELNEKKRYHTLAERTQRWDEMASVSNPEAANYDENFSSLSAVNQDFSDDSTYRYINDIGGYQAQQKQFWAENGTYVADNGIPYYSYTPFYIDNKYELMSDHQKALYNYYYALDKQNGTNMRTEYLESIQDTLNYVDALSTFEQLEERTGLELAFGVAAGIDQFTGGVESLLSNKDYIPTSTYQYVSGMVREDLADNGATLPDWLGGSSIGQIAYDAISTTANMLPSIAVSAINPAAGTIMLGASAAGHAKSEMLNLGYNKGQANLYGALVGASEAGLQYLLGGIGRLGGKVSGNLTERIISKVDNALARVAITLGTSMASEGFEESLQTIVEPWLKSLVTGVDFDAPDIDEVLYSGLLGALTAVFFEGGDTIVREGVRAGDIKSHGADIIEDGGVENLKNLANKMHGVDGTPNSKGIERLTKKVESNPTARNVGRLYDRVQRSVNEQNRIDIASALEKSGLTRGDARTYAYFLTSNEPLTEEQQAEIEGNEKIAEVVKELVNNKDSVVNQRKLNLLAARLGVDMKNSTINAKTTTSGNVALKNDVDVSEKVSEEGKTTKVSTGEVITIDKGNAIAKTKVVDGERVVYYNTDHGVVEATDVTYANEEEGLLFEGFSDMNPAFANAAIKNYDNSVPVETYIKGMREGIVLYGMHNFQAVGKDISRNSDLAALSEADQSFALKLGRAYAKANANKSEKALKTAIKNAAEKAEAEGKASDTAPKKGKVRFDSKVDRGKLNRTQRRTVSLAKHLAAAIGIDIVFYDARTTKDKNGKGANGYFDPKDNSIHLDLQNAVTDSKTIAFTLSHELVHFIKKWSPAKYNTFSKFLMEQYAAHGVSTSTLLANKMAALGTTDADLAYEEMIADACERMLLDSNAVVKLMELRKADLELVEKIKLHVLELLNKIRDAFKGIDPNTYEGIALQKMEDVLGKIHEMFEDAAVDAALNYNSIGSRNLEDFSDAKNTDGEPLFQYKAMQADENTYRTMLTKWGKMTDAQVDNLFDTIDLAMELIKDNLEVLDYAWEADIDDRAFSPVKPNSDKLYQVSLDFSTLCRKRILQQTIQAQLQEALNQPLTKAEGIAIRDALIALQEEGRQIEVACALCYVESARMKSPEQIKKFVENREAVIKEFFAGKSGGSMKEKLSKAETDARERLHKENPNGIKGKDGSTMLDPRTAKLNQLPKKYADVIRSAKKEAKASYVPTSEEQRLIDIAKGMTVSDFTSPEGLENLAKNYRELFDAYTSYVRNATKSKGIESDTWWRAGDSMQIGDVLIANMNRENGLRSQSWSDFQVVHILDYIAATIELATRNTKEQAYTKVPDFAELMGQTGVMINLSLIPAAKFNGKLEYDSVEGIDYKRSLELRDKYHSTVGTICIGIDNVQIQMLLDDVTVDYVIPYHKSGMSAVVRKAMHIPTWSQYEEYQSEKSLSRAEAKKQADKYGVKLLAESDPNYQKGTSFSEWFDLKEARQIAKMENANPSDKAKHKKYGVMYGGYMAMQNAANNYLKLCAERGLSPKFSHEKADFTEEDNYWKLLIDRKMVDNVTGEVIEQQTIKPIFDEGEIMRILNDELERYPKVKEDQDYAIRTVTEKMLSGEVKGGMSAEAIAKVMKKPVDNVTNVNILASSMEADDGIKKQAKASQKDTDSVKREISDGVKKQRKKVYETKLPDNAENIAKEHFGTTNDWSETGWLLTDGTQLDFSGRHWENDPDSEIELGESYYRGKRNMEHYEIAEAFPELREYSQMEYRDIHLGKFLNRGNIRIVGKGIVAIETMPTEEQFEKLRGYFMENVDKGAVIGIGVGGLNYREGTSASTIIEGIRDYFSKSRANQSDLMRFHTDDDGVLFQKKPTSNRTLLANALESVANEGEERNTLRNYKTKIRLIESEQQKLAEVREKANELRFTKGRTPEETKQMKALDFEAKQIENRIHTYDRQLLNLESTAALKNVLQREKEQARKREAQKGKEALAAYKEKAEQNQRELMKRYQDARDKNVEGRKKTTVRTKIKGIVSDLNTLLLNPTKDKHVPIGLQKPVAAALDIINMDTVGAEKRLADINKKLAEENDSAKIEHLLESYNRISKQRDKLSDKLTALKAAYAEIKNSEDPLVKNSHNEAIESLIENTIEVVGNTSLRDMSLKQLEAVYDMFKAIKATVRNANKMFKEGRQETVTENSEKVKAEVKAAGGHRERVLKATKWLKKVGWDMLKPLQAMRVVGSNTFAKLFENVRKGEDTWAVDVNEAKNFFIVKAKQYGYDSWDFKKQYIFFDSTGTSFSLSLEQIMSLYAYSKREQADKHLEVGGFIFDDAIEVTEKGKLGIPLKYEVNDANPYRLRKEDLGAVIGILDTDLKDVKGFVDDMQAYLSDVMGEKGNEVSLAMYDIKLYNEKHYFPLKTARYFREFDPEKNGTPKIKNSGFSKKTVPKAGNPIVLSNFMDVWANHVNDMSMYHSFVLPLEDFMRVYNYSSTAGGYDSVQQYIKNAYGSQANQYIERLMEDLNGGARVDPSAGIINKGIGLFKKAAVFASASVVIQQPSAMARAMAYIDPKYFVDKPKATKHKETWDEVKKYAPVAIIKEMGYFDTNMGRSTVDWIKDQKTVMDKIDDIASKAPALADELAWCAIWKAVKREVADTTKLEVGSEDFLKRAGERFTEVITNTQVYDSVLSRSGMMRSKDTGMKMATAFMAEPTTALNMVVDAVVQGKRGSKKFAAKTIGAVASSIILNSILVSLVYAARDDDEDETYTEKYLASLTTELIDGFNPLTYIPFVKDVWSIAQGYDVERSDMSIVGNFWESIENLFNDNKSGFEKTEGVVGAIASFFGLPLKNLMRDARAMYNLTTTLLSGTPTTKAGVADAVGESAKSTVPLWARIEKWAGAADSKSDNLYDAIMSGDRAHIERLKSGYKDEKAITTAIRAGLRENDSRIKDAAQARIDGDISEYTRIVRDIIAEGNFVQDIIVGAVNAEINAINAKADDQDEATDEEDASEKVSSIYRGSDINDAFENGDNSLAVSIIDDLINTKVANGMEEKSAKSSVKSSITSYWKPLYIAAYKSGNTEEMRRIRMILKESGLYGRASDILDTCKAWLKEKN